MYAGVDDETNRTPHLVRELTELRVRILVQAKFGTEAFGVESPAFDKCCVASVATEVWHSFQRLRQCHLQVMTRYRLVGAQDLHLPYRARVELVSVDEILSGSAGRDRPWLVVRRRL